jgi:hypothetical protein
LSANSPEVEEKQNIGRLYGVYYDSAGKKIRGEIWIDVDKAEKVHSAIVSSVRNGGRLEVSTGMYFTTDNTSGEWNGESFDGRVIDMRPDHLALLPDNEGACSWADGCGVRNNAGKEKNPILFDDDALEKIEGSLEGLKAEDKKTFVTRLVDNVVRVYKWFQKNEMSHDDVRDAVRLALKDSIPGKEYIWVKELFDSYAIYEINDMNGGNDQLWKRSYSIDKESGKVTLGDNPVEVREETNYLSVENAGKESEPADNKSVNVKEDVMKVEEMVKALIANDQTKYTDEDKEWLTNLSEDQLAKLEPAEEKKEPVKTKPEVNKEKIETNDADDDPSKKPEKVMSVDEYVKTAPPEIANSLIRMLDNDRAAKDKLVKSVLDNKQNGFSEESLRAMEIDDLVNLNKLAGNAIEVNYELRGGGDPPATNKDDEVPEPLKAFGANSVSEERAKAK